MDIIQKFIQKLLIFSKAPQEIGLSQLRDRHPQKKDNSPSLKQKDIKLSDLMRRVG